MSLEAHGLWFGYTPGQTVLRGINLRVDPECVLFILGPNGCGKSTFLACLHGALTPDRGNVRLEGHLLSQFSSRERAKRIAFVPQIHEPVFAYDVEEFVLMGRTPYVRWFSGPSPADRAYTREALSVVGVSPSANRPYTTLSGGEQRLVLLARALAQGGRYLLLDEPDAHLDPGHQHQVLSLVDRIAADGRGVIISSHNPNNACAYGTHTLLMRDGAALNWGAPEKVVSAMSLEQAYGVPFTEVRDEAGRRAFLPGRPPVAARRSG